MIPQRMSDMTGGTYSVTPLGFEVSWEASIYPGPYTCVPRSCMAPSARG